MEGEFPVYSYQKIKIIILLLLSFEANSFFLLANLKCSNPVCSPESIPTPFLTSDQWVLSPNKVCIGAANLALTWFLWTFTVWCCLRSGTNTFCSEPFLRVSLNTKHWLTSSLSTSSYQFPRSRWTTLSTLPTPIEWIKDSGPSYWL